MTLLRFKSLIVEAEVRGRWMEMGLSCDHAIRL